MNHPHFVLQRGSIADDIDHSLFIERKGLLEDLYVSAMERDRTIIRGHVQHEDAQAVTNALLAAQIRDSRDRAYGPAVVSGDRYGAGADVVEHRYAISYAAARRLYDEMKANGGLTENERQEGGELV